MYVNAKNNDRKRIFLKLFQSNWSWKSQIWMRDNDKCYWQKIYSGHTNLSHVRVNLPQMLVIHVSDDISAVEDRHTTCCVCLLKLACTLYLLCTASVYTSLQCIVRTVTNGMNRPQSVQCSWGLPCTQYNRSLMYIHQCMVCTFTAVCNV